MRMYDYDKQEAMRFPFIPSLDYISGLATIFVYLVLVESKTSS